MVDGSHGNWIRPAWIEPQHLYRRFQFLLRMRPLSSQFRERRQDHDRRLRTVGKMSATLAIFPNICPPNSPLSQRRSGTVMGSRLGHGVIPRDESQQVEKVVCQWRAAGIVSPKTSLSRRFE